MHRSRLKGDNTDVVVKVQHPSVQDLMMTDIKFDLHSIAKEMEKHIGFEFDFKTEIAKSKHYELPTSFFKLVLGKHLKYRQIISILWHLSSSVACMSDMYHLEIYFL